MDQAYQLGSYLHFGATVHLSCFRDKTNFYLFSNGICFKSLMALAAYDGPIQASKALFKITPLIKFQAQQFLDKLLKERYQNQQGIKVSQEQIKVFLDQFQFELGENNILIEQQNRYRLKYNDDFMLQHLYSSKYLTYTKNDKTNQYMLQLSQIPTKYSIFNLQSCFNYQKDINVYIPFNSAAYLNIKIYQGLQIKNYYLNFKKDSIFEAWTTSEEEKQPISIGLYQSAQELEYKDICYGDTVWIFHLESGSFVKLIEHKSVQSFILKKINFALGRVKQGQDLKEQVGNPSALPSQIFLQRSQNQNSAQKYGLWKIIYARQKANNIINRKQHFDRFKGGRVRFDQEVRFYNIRHHVYLSVRKVPVRGKQGKSRDTYVLSTQKNQQDNTAFRIKSLSPNSIYATTQDLFLIQHVLTQTYLTLQDPFQINQTKARLSPQKQFKKQDNFKFTKLQFIQEWQNNSILSILPFLRQGIKVFNQNETLIDSRQQILLQLLVQNLIQLLSFSYDLTQGFQASSNKLGKMTYNHYQVQKILKDQGIIDYLIMLLKIINPGMIEKYVESEQKDCFKARGPLNIIKGISSELITNKKNIPIQGRMVKKIVNLAFKILRNCCKSNNQNSLLLFNQIPVFAKFLSLQTYAQQFFIDSFSKQIILDKMTRKQFLLIFQQYLKIFNRNHQHSDKFFKLLIHFFECQGQPVGKNQLQAYRLAFQKNNKLVIPIQTFDNFIVNYHGKRFQLKQFAQKYPKQGEVIASQINFFAYLTYGRNYVCSGTIKQIFPISVLFKYIQSDIDSNIKASLINVFTHAYLNQRPRFIRKIQKVFPIYGINTKGQFQQSLLSHRNMQHNQNTSEIYQYQMKQLQSSGLSQNGINDILDCVSHKNHVSRTQMRHFSNWLLTYINDRLAQSNDLFYSYDIQSSFTCVRYMIQLGVFGVQEQSTIIELIKNIVKRISQSLQLQNQKKIQLKSQNFKQLLLQMVQKNVIKRFNYSAKFDGFQDQVNPQNICFQYVNFAFYQNILLLQKNSQNKRKQSVKVIASVLQLISLFNNLNIQQKIVMFFGEIIQNQDLLKMTPNKQKKITQLVKQRILKDPMKGKQDILRLLLLLFYNSNMFNINYASISLLSNQIFTQRYLIQSLQKIVFITQRDQQAKMVKLRKIYDDIKIMSQTTEIWLNSQYESSNYQYNSLILYFIDRIRAALRLIITDFRQQRWTPFDCVAGLQHDINLQRQIILSNIDFQQQILNILRNYNHFLLKIKGLTRTNQLFLRMFKYCLLFMYVFIYNCPQNKQKLDQHIQDIPISRYFLNLCPIQLGQSRFLIQYLKDNYKECLDFYLKYNGILSKFDKYTESYSKLLLTLLSYYGEPIQANLKKFFVNIFDFNAFKQFLWLKKEGQQFQLNLTLFLQQDKQPYFYHINVIDALLYLYDNLGESTNTIKNHIRKSLSQQYLFSLLKQDDYFTKENSLKNLLKVQVMFKLRIIKLIIRIYLHQASPAILGQLQKYNKILNMFIAQARARLQTDDFRKMIILKDVKQQQNTRVDFKITQMYTITFGQKYVITVFLQGISLFAQAVMRYQTCYSYHTLAQSVKQQVIEVEDILHSSSKLKRQLVIYPIPNQLNFKLINPKKTIQFQRKKHYMSIILQTIYNKDIYKVVEQNQLANVRMLKKLLEDINLKQFLFFRKISQFLEDAFQKLQEDNGEVNRTLTTLMNILKLFIKCQNIQKGNQIRQLMGKSQLIFPILNYFQTAVMNVSNRKLFLNSLQYLNQLLGDDGHRMIQTIFNSYFTNKSDSIDFFMKIKQILIQINFQQTALYRCRRLYDGIESYYNDTRSQKQSQFILLTFFINLCKGNFGPNQLYLGSLANTSNFNITRAIWEILKYQSQKYKNHLVNVQNYYRITQCLSTIRQLVEGPCLQNQNKFLKRDFFLTVLSYLQYQPNNRGLELQASLQKQLTQISQVSKTVSQQLRVYLNQDKITRDWMPSQVKYRCISLISSLMSQNCNQKSISQLLTIPQDMLVRELDRVHQRFQQLKLTYKRQYLQFSQQDQVILPLGFKIYQVLQYYPKDQLPQSSPGLDFFKQNSRLVQVMHQNLTIVVFPKIQTQISQAFKAQFLQTADRTSINSKLRDLQNAQIQNRQSDYPYGYILFFCTILLVLFDLIIYIPDTLPFVQNMHFYSIFLAYGFFQVLQPLRATTLFSIVVLSAVFMYLEVRGAVYMRQTLSAIVDSQYTRWQKFKTIIGLFISNLDYFHYAFTMLLAIFGIFNPLFDSLVLVIQLFRRSQTFFIILKAIKQTMDQLCVVLLINLILTYILTSILYFYYGQTAYSANCATLYYCFIFSLSIGFKADAGFVGLYDGDHLENHNYDNVKLFDVIVNFSYLFIIKVIMDQVIGAIIVDKFAQIRQQRQSLQQDQNKYCFICGIQRNILDRQQDGFQKHKQHYHVIWNYMQFLIHIKQSKLGNLTGIERFVYDQYKSGKLNWFPINRSFHLESKKQLEEEQSVSREMELENLKKMMDGEVDGINQHLSQMQEIINLKPLKEKRKEEK